MRATELLQAEHRVIEMVLACLEQFAQETAAHHHLDGVLANQFLVFFRHFADECHHGKEEQLLFPLLAAHGFAHERGPLGVMLHEHELGRRLSQTLTDTVALACQGDPAAMQRFAKTAEEYICLLRSHIIREDQFLFPKVDATISPAEQQNLVQAFASWEQTTLPPGFVAHYQQWASLLASRFPVDCF